jgi:DNA-binding NarL/FixJ family response regulator
LLPHLKAARPAIKVILCSGYVWDETMRDLERSGVDAFLEKPVQMDILGRTIRKVLDKK